MILGKIKKVKIIGVPPSINQEKALKEINNIIKTHQIKDFII